MRPFFRDSRGVVAELDSACVDIPIDLVWSGDMMVQTMYREIVKRWDCGVGDRNRRDQQACLKSWSSDVTPTSEYPKLCMYYKYMAGINSHKWKSVLTVIYNNYLQLRFILTDKKTPSQLDKTLHYRIAPSPRTKTQPQPYKRIPSNDRMNRRHAP